MIGKLARDESGMTMGLVVIMIVLIGVLGAGLLTFVRTGLNSVVEVNQGQKALEVADAGVQAAQRQLVTDNDAVTNYDGVSDSPWSYCYMQTGCTSATPTTPGSAGMTIDTGTGSARVTILTIGGVSPTFRVISEGTVGNAKRKVEAILRIRSKVTFPRAYLTRNNLTLTGSASPSGVSFFAMGNANGNNKPMSGDDGYYLKWAATPDSGSYPNAYNERARDSALAGIGALGTVTDVPNPGRSYGSNTCPAIVRNYATDSPPAGCATKMAFPFYVPTDAEDREQLEVLRQRALTQETRTRPLYIDSDPGNQRRDPGLLPGNQPINDWPSGSDFGTVRFYAYAAYNSSNTVSYSVPFPCGDETAKGIIAVENGDFKYAANNAFNGAVIVRAYNASGASIPTQGKFEANGTPCLKGYANSGGDMTISGNINAGQVPDLANQVVFRDNAGRISWRELYE